MLINYIYEKIDKKQCPFGVQCCENKNRRLAEWERDRGRFCLYCWKNYLDKQKKR